MPCLFVLLALALPRGVIIFLWLMTDWFAGMFETMLWPQHVDDPTVQPYDDVDVIWSGVGILDYLILPHYKSDHPESAAIDTEVAYCLDRGIPLRTLRDGEVILIDDLARSTARR